MFYFQKRRGGKTSFQNRESFMRAHLSHNHLINRFKSFFLTCANLKQQKMKKYGLQLILFTGLIFTLTQCQSAKKGEKFVNGFFIAIMNQDYEKAVDMIDLPAVGNSTDILQQVQLIGNNPINGQLKRFKKGMGFNTNIKNGVTTVELDYKLTYENGENVVHVVTRDKGDGFKIVSVQ